jgi:ubiquinone/menaquinone biosynthesis C-methylase UbiE
MKIGYSGEQVRKYADFAEDSYSWRFLERSTMRKHLKSLVKENSHILDAGCGTGRSIRPLLELGAKPDNLIGTDISPEMLEIAQNAFPNVKFIQNNLQDLKLKKNCLDIVVSNMTFHYLNLKDFERTIKNISNWLVEGGICFFIVVHPLRFVNNHAEYFDDKIKMLKTTWGTEMEYYPKKTEF